MHGKKQKKLLVKQVPSSFSGIETGTRNPKPVALAASVIPTPLKPPALAAGSNLVNLKF
jgi:hypothetical protein